MAKSRKNTSAENRRLRAKQEKSVKEYQAGKYGKKGSTAAIKKLQSNTAGAGAFATAAFGKSVPKKRKKSK